MAVNLSPVGGVAAQFLDNNGNVLTGGKIYTYAAGTTTPQASYTSAAGTTAHSNPIILDASGRVPGGEIWLTDGLQYKVAIYTADNVLIGTYDNVIGINSNFVNFVTAEEVQIATAGQTVFTLTTMQYQPGTNNLVVYVDGVNQVEGGSYSFVETNSTTVTFTDGLHVGAVVKFVSAEVLSTNVTDASTTVYTPAGSGAVTTNVQAKLRETVSVKDFGAVGDGVTDDSQAFQDAIDFLPTEGGKILVPTGAYLLNTKPIGGTKSIYWDIDPSCIWLGAGTIGNGSFPRATTNISMLPVGPFFQAQSSTLTTAPNATGAFVVEFLQPVNLNGGTVAVYAGSQSDNNQVNSNQWAANFLVKAESNSTGGAWGLEIDVDSYSSGAIYFGLDVTGIGTENPDFGAIVRRADSTLWKVGLEIRKSIVGINLDATGLSRGIVVNSPAVIDKSIVSAKGIKNNSTMVFLQRFTDTAPTGYFQSFVDEANTTQLFSVDVLGNVVGNTLTAKGAAASTFVNSLQLGGTTSNSATAGLVPLPANATGFLNAYLGNVPIKIPFYSN